MATNLHALLRYNVLDECFRDKTQVHTLNSLAFACQRKLEIAAISEETIKNDIQNMRSGKLGYTAPIVYNRTSGYYYSKSFSIKKLPLTKMQSKDLYNALYLLKQLTQNAKLESLTSSLEEIRQKIDYATNTHDYKPVVYFEESLNKFKQDWLKPILDFIIDKQTIKIGYKPFGQDQASHILSPYLLKEYNRRWYIIGYSHNIKTIINLSLDRIESIDKSLADYHIDAKFNHDSYYKNVYGVTIKKDEALFDIEFIANPMLSHYIDTKPMHKTQQCIKQSENGNTYHLKLILNYEIKQKLFSFGKDIKILQPQELVDIISEMGREVSEMYKRNVKTKK